MLSADQPTVLATAALAYRLLWRHRGLHVRAVWPPVIFLASAEFLYHRTVGNAHSVHAWVGAILAAPWYRPFGMVACWLAGLKFLLSFSISWRRFLLLGERFDPFFFRRPFWRYLGFLLLTYAWILPVAAIPAGLALLLARGGHGADIRFAVPPVALAAVAFILWGVVRQVPFFTSLTLDPPQPGLGDAIRAMRGQVPRYLGAFAAAMLPLVCIDMLLDTALTHAGADRHAIHVALGESGIRQTILFLHFSLGASIGAVTSLRVLGPALRVGEAAAAVPVGASAAGARRS